MFRLQLMTFVTATIGLIPHCGGVIYGTFVKNTRSPSYPIEVGLDIIT